MEDCEDFFAYGIISSNCIMENTKPKIFFMIGAPLSGKSTYISEHYSDLAIMSRDSMVLIVAGIDNYNEAWKVVDQKMVDHHLQQHFEHLLNLKRNFVIDMTNMSKKSRRRWISRIDKKQFDLVAIVLRPPLELLLERNQTRPGKTIPEHIVRSMYAAYEEPTNEEGFSEVIYV